MTARRDGVRFSSSTPSGGLQVLDAPLRPPVALDDGWTRRVSNMFGANITHCQVWLGDLGRFVNKTPQQPTRARGRTHVASIKLARQCPSCLLVQTSESSIITRVTSARILQWRDRVGGKEMETGMKMIGDSSRVDTSSASSASAVEVGNDDDDDDDDEDEDEDGYEDGIGIKVEVEVEVGWGSESESSH